MKKAMCLLMFILCCGLQLLAAPQTELNMREYIQKYGKPGDDTEAFRQAVQEIQRKRLRYLHLPAGSYYLTDTIDLSALANGEIRGDGYPEIIMKDENKDIFIFNSVWKLKIEGLSFHGGKNQLQLSNNNTDRTNIIISNCKFQKAGEFAIKFGREMVSAHVLIDACSFYSNRQVLQSTGDWVRLSNSWITTSPKMFDQAAIVNYGCLTIDHVLGVPLVKTPRAQTKQRWIDNYGLKLTCRDTRFGGEGGGLPIIYNYRAYRWKYPVVPSSILLTDCWIYCAGTQVIRFFEIPNNVTIDSCTGLIDTRMFLVEPSANLEYLEKNPARIKRLILFRVNDTDATMQSVLPGILKNAVHGGDIKFSETKGKPAKAESTGKAGK